MVVFRMLFHGKKFIGMIPFDPIGNPVLIDLFYLFKKKRNNFVGFKNLRILKNKYHEKNNSIYPQFFLRDQEIFSIMILLIFKFLYLNKSYTSGCSFSIISAKLVFHL